MREISILARLDNADEIVGALVAFATYGSLVTADAVLDVLRKPRRDDGRADPDRTPPSATNSCPWCAHRRTR